MAKMFKDISKFTLRFKSISDPDEVIEFQSMREFDTEEEAEEFVLKIMGICSPIHDAEQYEVKAWFGTEESTTEKPM